nr:ANTAR domain-containing protein [Microbacterium sp. CFBP 8794]
MRLRNAEDLARQLQRALDSRIVIEQAKGVVSRLLECSVEHAFSLLRSSARRNTLPLRTVAARIVDRSVTPTTLLAEWQGR